MDYNTLIMLGIIIVALGLVILPFYLKKKNILTQADLENILPIAITGSNLFFELIDDLNLVQEPEIKKIGKVLEETLKFCELNVKNNLTDEQVFSYVESMCVMFKLELNEDRVNLIKRLLIVGIKEIKSRY